jgi:hypothetical protein
MAWKFFVLSVFAAPPGRTVRTIDGLGTEIFGAVEGNQHMTVGAAELFKPAGLFQRRKHCGERRIEQRRRRRIEHGANMIVGGNFGDAKQTLAV